MINAPSGDPNNLEIGQLVCFFSRNKLKFQEDCLIDYCINDKQLSLNEVSNLKINISK